MLPEGSKITATSISHSLEWLSEFFIFWRGGGRVGEWEGVGEWGMRGSEVNWISSTFLQTSPELKDSKTSEGMSQTLT